MLLHSGMCSRRELILMWDICFLSSSWSSVTSSQQSTCPVQPVRGCSPRLRLLCIRAGDILWLIGLLKLLFNEACFPLGGLSNQILPTGGVQVQDIVNTITGSQSVWWKALLFEYFAMASAHVGTEVLLTSCAKGILERCGLAVTGLCLGSARDVRPCGSGGSAMCGMCSRAAGEVVVLLKRRSGRHPYSSRESCSRTL